MGELKSVYESERDCVRECVWVGERVRDSVCGRVCVRERVCEGKSVFVC